MAQILASTIRVTFREQIAAAKIQIYRRALEGRTVTEAARVLGMSRTYLHREMTRYGIAKRPRPRWAMFGL